MLWIDAYGRVWETQKTRFGTYVARIVYGGCSGPNGESYGPWIGIDVPQMEQLGFFKVP